MKAHILLLIAIIGSISFANAECTTDCANGYKIIIDVFYCKGIFGDPACGNVADCPADYNKFKDCAYTGCFGELSNLASINDFNTCFKKCEPSTDPVKQLSKGMYNCLDVANSQIIMFSLSLLISIYLLM